MNILLSNVNISVEQVTFLSADLSNVILISNINLSWTENCDKPEVREIFPELHLPHPLTAWFHHTRSRF